MKSIKREIDSHINDAIIESYNMTRAMFIREKIKLINSLRKTGRFGHLRNQGLSKPLSSILINFKANFNSGRTAGF